MVYLTLGWLNDRINSDIAFSWTKRVFLHLFAVYHHKDDRRYPWTRQLTATKTVVKQSWSPNDMPLLQSRISESEQKVRWKQIEFSDKIEKGKKRVIVICHITNYSWIIETTNFSSIKKQHSNNTPSPQIKIILFSIKGLFASN